MRVYFRDMIIDHTRKLRVQYYSPLSRFTKVQQYLLVQYSIASFPFYLIVRDSKIHCSPYTVHVLLTLINSFLFDRHLSWRIVPARKRAFEPQSFAN